MHERPLPASREGTGEDPMTDEKQTYEEIVEALKKLKERLQEES